MLHSYERLSNVSWNAGKGEACLFILFGTLLNLNSYLTHQPYEPSFSSFLGVLESNQESVPRMMRKRADLPDAETIGLEKWLSKSFCISLLKRS